MPGIDARVTRLRDDLPPDYEDRPEGLSGYAYTLAEDDLIPGGDTEGLCIIVHTKNHAYQVIMSRRDVEEGWRQMAIGRTLPPPPYFLSLTDESEPSEEDEDSQELPDLT